MGNIGLNHDADPNKMNGFSPIEEGRYHCMILDVVSGMCRNGKPYDRLKLMILAGEQPGQEEKTLNTSLFYKEKNGGYTESDAHVRWAWAAGLLKPGENIDFTPSMLRGKQVIVEVVQQKDSQFSEVAQRGYAVSTLDSPEVASVPKAKIAPPYEGDDYL